MVNPNSPTYKFSEKVGLVISKTIRYPLFCALALFIVEKLGKYIPNSHVNTNPYVVPSSPRN